MEGKPTAKPSQESGPDTRKLIIIKKKTPKNPFIGFALSEEGNTSFFYIRDTDVKNKVDI